MQVAFGGLAELMNTMPARVAAARKIPYTRFMGNPPKGMNATGESDQDNYILMMEANREAKMRDVLGMQLDPILARHAGLKEAPEYEWRSLLELSDRDVAEAAKLKAEALQIAVERAIGWTKTKRVSPSTAIRYSGNCPAQRRKRRKNLTLSS